MARLFVMLESMAIPSDASELLPSTIGQTTCQAQPEVGSQFTVATLGRNWDER
jgi:hypothetical protein